MLSANAQRMLGECIANDRRAFAESPSECSANAQRMLSDCSPNIRLAFTFHMQMSFSANAFGECLANVQRMLCEYLICIKCIFRRMFGRMFGECYSAGLFFWRMLGEHSSISQRTSKRSCINRKKLRYIV